MKTWEAIATLSGVALGVASVLFATHLIFNIIIPLINILT